MKKIILLFSSILFISRLFAQGTPDTTNKPVMLNEVEITSTSNPNKKVLYQPASIIKLNQTELKRGDGLYLDDAINMNVPGVFMERRTISAGQQFNIRGYGNGPRGTRGISSNFDGQGYKVYLNGIPLTDAEGVTVMDDIDFSSVGNVEILKGPVSSIYGLAISGVVNLQTQKVPKGKTYVGQNVMFGSYGLKRFTTSIGIGGENSSLLINYGRQQCDGFVTHTASNKDFVTLMGDFSLNNKQTITTYFGYSNSYDERQGELTYGQFDTLNFSGNPRYINNNAHSEVIGFRTGVGHTYKFSKHISNTTSLFGSGFSTNASSASGWTDTRPVNLGFRSTIDISGNLSEKVKLSGIIGFEGQSQYYQTTGYSMVVDSFKTTQGPLGPYNIIGPITSNGSTINKTSSIFTDWTLTLPNDISLTAGVGISSVDIDYKSMIYSAANNNPAKNKNQTLTHYGIVYKNLVYPHFAINKVFKKQVSVYASYGMGRKTPISGLIFIPNTNMVNTGLKPESGMQFEIGTKGTLLNSKLNYQLAIFDAVFADKMTAVSVPDPNKTVTLYSYMVNGGKQDDKGVEALVRYTAYQSEEGFLKSFTPFVNIAYSDFKYKNFSYQKVGKDMKGKDSLVTVDYSGLAVAGVPPITFALGVDIDTKAGLYGNINYLYHDKMPYTSDGLNVARSYNLLNAKIGFRKQFAKHFEVDAYVGGINLKGERYSYKIFINQLPDAYIPAPNKPNFYGGINLKYIF